MTTAAVADIRVEVEALRKALAAASDPSYTTGMRRVVPSGLPAHSTRLPEVRRIGSAWSRDHKSVPAADRLAVADALWVSGWREEMLLAAMLVSRDKGLVADLPWEVIERWSSSIENWEHVDNLASSVTGSMLAGRHDLCVQVGRLAGGDSPWQRRLAIVTLIEAHRRDPSLRPLLSDMAARFRADPHPTNKKAAIWAQRELAGRIVEAPTD